MGGGHFCCLAFYVMSLSECCACGRRVGAARVGRLPWSCSDARTVLSYTGSAAGEAGAPLLLRCVGIPLAVDAGQQHF